MDIHYTLFFVISLVVLVSNVGCNHHHHQKIIRPRAPPIPRITTLRRQIRNFVPGSRASVTIVYQTAEPYVNVRWFRGVKAGTMPFAELLDMLPVEGDGRYDNSSITAGNVIATTLIIKKVTPEVFPAKFTLVLGIDSVPMQYQVDVHVDKETQYRREYLDGVRWVTKPPPTISFGYKGRFVVQCSTMLDTESMFFLDELHLYRTYLEIRRKRDRSGKLVSLSCGRVHRSSNNYLEQSEKYTFEGTRKVMKHGYVKYHVMLGARNATREEQGMYTCALERKNDRTYVSSWVRQGNLHSKPFVEFLPCEGGMFNEKKQMLHFLKHQETCFRCRGYGYPLPYISVIKDGRKLRARNDLLIDHHLNVPDGGLSESTYTFLNPNYQNAGGYECLASNSKGEASFDFSLAIIEY